MALFERSSGGYKTGLTGIGVLILVVLPTVVVLGLGLLWYATEKTSANEVALSYGGGPFEGAEFQGVTGPASGIKVNGLADKWYVYNVDQRDYTVSEEDGADVKGWIKASTSDGADCFVQLVVPFKLNANESPVRSFHENIGIKFDAWTEEGWNKMLAVNFNSPLQNAVQQECRKFTSEEVRKDPKVIQAMGLGVAAGLKESVNAQLGGDDWFCGAEFKIGDETCPDFTVSIKNVSLSQELNAVFEAQVASEKKIVTATNDGKAKEQKALGDKAAQEAKATSQTPEYFRDKELDAMLECAKNQNCTLVIQPGGGVVPTLNVGK